MRCRERRSMLCARCRLGRMRSTLETIPDGDAGLAVKLRGLRALVDKAKADPWFRRWTLDQVRAAGVRERDYAGELAAVARAARSVRYTRCLLYTSPSPRD